MNLPAKHQALLAGIVAGITQFAGWFIALPPSQQTASIAPIIAVVPPDWQSTIAVWMKTIGGISLIFATFKAAQSGPQTPPKNPPV